MKIIRKIFYIIITTILLNTVFVYAASSYNNENINNININYVSVELGQNIKPLVLNANNQMNSTDSLANMAKNAGAFAAINGTYFEAYNGTPVPWGTIIKDNKVLHISNGGSVVGITDDGKLLVDRLSFDFEGYINGQYRAIPWRINHPSTEAEAITIFTPEYGTSVKMSSGAKAVLVSNKKVIQIATSDFTVPVDGFAIVYNSSVSYLVDERYKIGDEVYYKIIIKTTFTEPSDWENIACALGAGPSLIINGNITADGLVEGFTEAKINTNKATRSFIGAKADGTIVFGNMASATVKEAAAACLEMGLVNAMCLDGGGSTALYYPSQNISTSGRNINNGLAFVEEKIVGTEAIPTSSPVIVNGEETMLDAYNINNNNYFKLRDLGEHIDFNVSWESATNSIIISTN
ncbi:MAG: hypothetical protein GX818_06395 [Tissierellia bacterium]|nr:hypothetical protein [Tissierellia bacterium]